MPPLGSLRIAVASVCAPAVAWGQNALPLAHPLGATVVTSPVAFSAVNQLVPLGGGRVVVFDATRRRAVILDSTLSHPVVLLDSAAGRTATFQSGSFAMPFRGDSALVFDGAGLVVLTPEGQFGRVMAFPPLGPGLMFNSTLDIPLSSPQLGLIYRIRVAPPPAPRPSTGQPDLERRWDDSSFVVRMNFETRKIDTLVTLAAGGRTFQALPPIGSARTVPMTVFPFYDEAAVLSDGSLALLHARDFRVDWIDRAGALSVGPRLPYPWTHLDDAMRNHLLDSVNASRHRSYDSAMARRAADSAQSGSAPKTTIQSVDADGLPITRSVVVAPPRPPVLNLLNEIPDFVPPTSRRAVLADQDNHLWIRPIADQPPSGGPMWLVVDRAGAVIDRVLVAEGTSIVAFGHGGFVFVISRDGGVATLRKVRSSV